MPRVPTVLALLLFASPCAAQAPPEESGDAESEEQALETPQEATAQPEASAEEEPDEAQTMPDEEEARALFLAGRAAFEQGHIERALGHFVRAYELSDRPGLLYNIANSHDRLRHDAEALDYLERYLEALPDAGNGEFVRARIAVLRANVEEARSREVQQEAEREALVAERDHFEAEAQSVDATVSDAGIALMIGGGVSLLAMIGPAVWWSGSSRQLNDCRPAMGCDPRPILKRQDSATALTITFLVAALAAGGIGILLFAISPRGDAESAEEPEVACGATFGGVGCSGRF